MAVNEHDLELMEQWLDGELPEPQAEALRARLTSEPQLAQVLDRLRGDRKMRADVFAALEPANHDVDSLINNVRRAVRKEEVWAWRYRTLRQITGVAAAVAMVFTAGWISRSKLHVGPLPSSINLPSPAVFVTRDASATTAGVSTTSQPEVAPVPSNPGPGGVGSTVRVNMVDRNGFTRNRPTFKVFVVDPRNVIIGWKELENVGDANRLGVEFANFMNGRPPAPGQPPAEPPTMVNEPTR
jgi:hypothetical protein